MDYNYKNDNIYYNFNYPKIVLYFIFAFCKSKGMHKLNIRIEKFYIYFETS